MTMDFDIVEEEDRADVENEEDECISPKNRSRRDCAVSSQDECWNLNPSLTKYFTRKRGVELLTLFLLLICLTMKAECQWISTSWKKKIELMWNMKKMKSKMGMGAKMYWEKKKKKCIPHKLN